MSASRTLINKNQVKHIDLLFAQLTNIWAKSKYNTYSDTKKDQYHDLLGELYQKLNSESWEELTPGKWSERIRIIEFIFKSLEFLNSSTYNNAPFEIVSCLKQALYDWIEPESDDYELIIVTSFVNDINYYSFDPQLTDDELYDVIKAVYDLDFNSRLLQINLPAFTARDYLSNVVLYHELGHFIDRYFSLSEFITEEILERIQKPKLDKRFIRRLSQYLTILDGDLGTIQYDSDFRMKMENHLSEYISDLFASQYTIKCCSNYLEHVAPELPSDSHPLTSTRVQLVDEMLNSKNKSYFLNFLLREIKKVTKKRFGPKYDTIDCNDFLNLTPIDVEKPSQLHYLFSCGWDIWKGDWSEIQRRNGMNFDLTGSHMYGILNNLIEKSINNYTTREQWRKAHNNGNT